MPLRLLAQPGGLVGKGERLVMQRDDADAAQDRLAQPAHAEQEEQKADRELQRAQRHEAEQRPEGHDDQRQQHETGHGAERGRLPAAHGPNRKHDRERLHDLDDGAQEVTG